MSLASSRYYLLYLAPLLAWLLSGHPVASYLVAWSGSFLIFYLSFTNKVKPTSPGTPLPQKILQPLFLTQIIFAGYMSVSSIFYFLDVMGYEYLTRIPGKRVYMEDVALTAACQRYYLLGHAALAHGLLYFYKPVNRPRYKVQVSNWPFFFLKVVLICMPLGMVMSRIGGLSVLGSSVEGLALVASTIAFALAIPLRKPVLTLIAAFIFAAGLAQALTSGFKEPVIVSVLMLGLFLFPFYKRTITAIFVPLLLFLFTVLPTYVNTFRSMAWSGDAGGEEAKQAALQKVREDMSGDNMKETNWLFLTGRISEIGMFVKYVQNKEEGRPHYGTEIIEQTLEALVPRVLWPEKPVTELVAMTRVIENGVVSEDSNVSAKPQYIVDGYLSGGAFGVWLALFVYGAIAQLVCIRAEVFFGGYFFGTAFVYTGMFRAMWRGNCFEFIYNNILYGILGLVALFYILRWLGVLAPAVEAAEAEAPTVPAC